MQQQNPIIIVKKVKQHFTTADGTIEVIKQADLMIRENTFNIIYGPSGSGKSTLLNIIAGLQKPSQGDVRIQDKDIYALDEDELAFFRASRIGIVYQTNYWVSSLNVIENVALPLTSLGYNRQKAEKLALESLKRIGMESYAHKNPMLLSGGEQQRIAMARAIVNTPLFIVADEPTGNLDIERGNQIIELLQSYRDEFRCTIILVTHNIDYLPVGDTIYQVEDGIVRISDGEEVRKKTEKLLNELKHHLSKLKPARLEEYHE